MRIFGIVLLLAGCSNPVESFFSTYQGASEATCECWMALDEDSQGECLGDLGLDWTPTQRECLADVVADHPNLQTYMDCSADAAATLDECIASVAACNDEALDNCFDEFEDSLEDVCGDFSCSTPGYEEWWSCLGRDRCDDGRPASDGGGSSEPASGA